jgi:hypothetical protein
MQAAAASGALVSVNHPKPFGPPWQYPSAVGYHAIEVWNGAWERHNHVSLAFWEAQLREGKRIVALGGSDTHNVRKPDADARHGRMLGRPTTWARVDGSPTAERVLQALRGGHAFISHDVEGPQVFLTPGGDGVNVRVVDAKGAAVVLVSADGVVATAPVTLEDWTDTFAATEARGYLRAQILDEHGEMLALTNPLFD